MNTITILALLISAVLILRYLAQTTRRQIETAIIATAQRHVLPVRKPGRPMHADHQARVLTLCTNNAFAVLGPWRRMLARITLGRWNIKPWLETEIESVVLRLKIQNRLPSSLDASYQFAGPAESLIRELPGMLETISDLFTMPQPAPRRRKPDVTTSQKSSTKIN